MDSTKIVQTVSMLAEGFALNGLKPSWGPRGSGPLRMLYWSGRALGRMLYWSGRACGLVGWWAVPVLYTVQCLWACGLVQCLWAYGLVGQYSTVPVGLWAYGLLGLWACTVLYWACGHMGSWACIGPRAQIGHIGYMGHGWARPCTSLGPYIRSCKDYPQGPGPGSQGPGPGPWDP